MLVFLSVCLSVFYLILTQSLTLFFSIVFFLSSFSTIIYLSYRSIPTVLPSLPLPPHLHIIHPSSLSLLSLPSFPSFPPHLFSRPSFPPLLPLSLQMYSHSEPSRIQSTSSQCNQTLHYDTKQVRKQS
jgi:hypothetical protein